MKTQATILKTKRKAKLFLPLPYLRNKVVRGADYRLAVPRYCRRLLADKVFTVGMGNLAFTALDRYGITAVRGGYHLFVIPIQRECGDLLIIDRYYNLTLIFTRKQKPYR